MNRTKDVLHIDIETYCDLELGTVGVDKYAEHPSFSILLLTYQFNSATPVTCTGISQAALDLIQDSSITKVAHNAMFEMTCLAAKGATINPEDWLCTMVMAKQLGYPGSLDQASQVLGLQEAKDQGGKALISLFSKPNVRLKRRIMPNEKPDDWRQFIEYNRQDVVVEHAIYDKLIPLYTEEQKLRVVDYRINKRGVKVDLDLAASAIALAEHATADAYTRAMKLTKLDKITDARLKQWILDEHGMFVDSLNKKAVPEIRKQRPELNELLDLREQLSKTSIKKYTAMQNAVCKDGRARGLTQYMGAGRTGRWSGRLIQLQNLPRIEMKSEALDIARRTVKANDAGLFQLLYGDQRLSTISQLVRTAMVPKEGHSFVVADFSAIEARVLAWLANEKWRLDVFNSHGKIYEASAEQMFNLPKGSVKKDDPERQKGKIAELALGYGGSVGAMINMGALEYNIPESELPKIVYAWRAANKGITYFWKELDACIQAAVRGTTYISPLLHKMNIHVTKTNNIMSISLPNGRLLSYINPRVSTDGRSIVYEGINQTTNQWCEQELYGAKATENVVQATARDALAGLLIRAEEMNLNPVFHVHDEVVCEVPTDQAELGLTRLLKAMKDPYPWSQGLPLVGDGFICQYYNK
jgi:DNA polymerase